MYEDSRSMMRRVLDLPGHLNELATCLRNLSARVRETVAEAVGNTLGRAVQDGLARLLDSSNRPEAQPSREEHFDHNDWERAVDDDGWDIDQSRMPESRPSPPPDPPPIQKTQLLALALKAGGLWLLRRGSWKGAIGLGLLIGGLAAVGGPIMAAGIGILEAASDLFALNNVIMTGAVLSAV